MVLIIGGAWQGKLDFARERFGLSEADLFICNENTAALDTSKRCVAYVDRWVLNRIRAGADPLAELEAFLPALEDAVVIATDVSGGVVPMDPTLRAWRETCGRMNPKLVKASDEIWRLFCGIPQRVK